MFLLDSYYKPDVRKRKLIDKAKRRLRYLGDFVFNLKYQGKILHDAYVAAHPEEDIEEAMIRKEEKKKQNEAEKARIKKEKD
jgi:hypothetical protein